MNCLCWGVVAQSQLNTFSYSIVMSLSLMLGTGIFTLAALGPKLVRANKAKFTSLINLKLYLRSFIDTIQVSKKLSNY